MKRTPLRRRTPLKARTALRTRTRLRPQSAKRRQVNAVRRKLAADLPDEPCRLKSPVCTGRAEHFHELVGRAQGGSIVDGRNLVPACDACNGWVEDHPLEARGLGFKVASWRSTETPTGRVPCYDHPLALSHARTSPSSAVDTDVIHGGEM